MRRKRSSFASPIHYLRFSPPPHFHVSMRNQFQAHLPIMASLFPCGECEEQFDSDERRWEHRKDHTSDECHFIQSFTQIGRCTLCTGVFQNVFHFYDHFKQVHNQTYTRLLDAVAAWMGVDVNCCEEVGALTHFRCGFREVSEDVAGMNEDFLLAENDALFKMNAHLNPGPSEEPEHTEESNAVTPGPSGEESEQPQHSSGEPEDSADTTSPEDESQPHSSMEVDDSHETSAPSEEYNKQSNGVISSSPDPSEDSEEHEESEGDVIESAPQPPAPSDVAIKEEEETVNEESAGSSSHGEDSVKEEGTSTDETSEISNNRPLSPNTVESYKMVPIRQEMFNLSFLETIRIAPEPAVASEVKSIPANSCEPMVIETSVLEVIEPVRPLEESTLIVNRKRAAVEESPEPDCKRARIESPSTSLVPSETIEPSISDISHTSSNSSRVSIPSLSLEPIDGFDNKSTLLPSDPCSAHEVQPSAPTFPNPFTGSPPSGSSSPATSRSHTALHLFDSISGRGICWPQVQQQLAVHAACAAVAAADNDMHHSPIAFDDDSDSDAAQPSPPIRLPSVSADDVDVEEDNDDNGKDDHLPVSFLDDALRLALREHDYSPQKPATGALPCAISPPGRGTTRVVRAIVHSQTSPPPTLATTTIPITPEIAADSAEADIGAEADDAGEVDEPLLSTPRRSPRKSGQTAVAAAPVDGDWICVGEGHVSEICRAPVACLKSSTRALFQEKSESRASPPPAADTSDTPMTPEISGDEDEDDIQEVPTIRRSPRKTVKIERSETPPPSTSALVLPVATEEPEKEPSEEVAIRRSPRKAVKKESYSPSRSVATTSPSATLVPAAVAVADDDEAESDQSQDAAVRRTSPRKAGAAAAASAVPAAPTEQANPAPDDAEPEVLETRRSPRKMVKQEPSASPPPDVVAPTTPPPAEHAPVTRRSPRKNGTQERSETPASDTPAATAEQFAADAAEPAQDNTYTARRSPRKHGNQERSGSPSPVASTSAADAPAADAAQPDEEHNHETRKSSRKSSRISSVAREQSNGRGDSPATSVSSGRRSSRRVKDEPLSDDEDCYRPNRRSGRRNGDIPESEKRRSVRVQAVKLELEQEVENKDVAYWQCQTASSVCPICSEKFVQKQERINHYQERHYDEFYRTNPAPMNDVDRWVSCEFGKIGTDGDRVCTFCIEVPTMHTGRIALLKHIRKEHKIDFKRLKEEYRLYSRTRSIHDLDAHKILS